MIKSTVLVICFVLPMLPITACKKSSAVEGDITNFRSRRLDSYVILTNARRFLETNTAQERLVILASESFPPFILEIGKKIGAAPRLVSVENNVISIRFATASERIIGVMEYMLASLVRKSRP